MYLTEASSISNVITNPCYRLIVHFKLEVPDADFKVSWKDVEHAVRAKLPKVKLVYSRADAVEGDLAFSTLRLNR